MWGKIYAFVLACLTSDAYYSTSIINAFNVKCSCRVLRCIETQFQKWILLWSWSERIFHVKAITFRGGEYILNVFECKCTEVIWVTLESVSGNAETGTAAMTHLTTLKYIQIWDEWDGSVYYVPPWFRKHCRRKS